MGPQRFNSARFVLPPHLSSIVVLPARPNKPRTRKTFGVCRTQMPQCADGPFFPHFASARAKGKRSFRTNWRSLTIFQSFQRDRRRLSPISQLICQISQLIFDQSHVNASHDVSTCKVIDLRTMDRLCVRGPNGRVSGQWKQRMENENAFRFPSLAVWG